MRPIIVIGPMDCEINIITSKLTNSSEKKIGGFTFTEGTINGKPVVTVKCLIGVVNSSAATAIAAREYNPSCIILEGTSGGHGPDTHKYDIILGENIVEIGSYYTMHRDEGTGSRDNEVEYPGAEMPVGGEILREKVLHSDKELIKTAFETDYQYGTLKAGTIGSSDIWNKEIDRILYLHNVLGTDCEEMEGFGVSQICRHFDIPMIDIRIVSNNEIYPDEQFSEDAGEICQQYVLKFLDRLTLDKVK